MPFQRALFAASVPTGLQTELTDSLTNPQSACAALTDDIFIGHRRQHLYQALNDGIGTCLISETPEKLLTLLSPPAEAEGELMLAIIAETRFLRGRSTAESIAHYLHDQAIVDVEVMQNYRLLLQEALTNAIEHGSLALSNEQDKDADQEAWFESYYTKVEDLLTNDPRGKRPITLFCFLDNGSLHTWITDQGDGFDVAQAYNTMDSANPYGKGLSLIAALSDAVKHNNGGRTCYFKIKARTRQAGLALPTRANVKEKGRILIVDDQKINRDLALHFLKSAGFTHLATAENGKEALEVVGSFQPDLILLDIMMPEMDGFEACQELKSNPATANIPVLFLSGLTDAKSRTQGYQLGAVDYVNKPIDRNEMVARTEVHIMNGMMFQAMETHSARVAEDLTNARQFQENLLPDQPSLDAIEQQHNVRIDSKYQATEELAGDYWSLKSLDDDHIAFSLADFTGHGMLAALNTIHLHTLFLELESLMPDPVAFTKALNQRLVKQLNVDQFATFVYGILNTKTGDIRYTACGAPPFLIIPEDPKKTITAHTCGGLPLGIATADVFSIQEQKTHIQPGDTLFLFSDALIETLHKDEQIWDDDGLLTAANKVRGYEGKSQLQNILKYFNRTANYPLEDDLTLLNIHFQPTTN